MTWASRYLISQTHFCSRFIVFSDASDCALPTSLMRMGSSGPPDALSALGASPVPPPLLIWRPFTSVVLGILTLFPELILAEAPAEALDKQHIMDGRERLLCLRDLTAGCATHSAKSCAFWQALICSCALAERASDRSCPSCSWHCLTVAPA